MPLPPRKDLIARLNYRASIKEPHNHLMARTNEERAHAADMLTDDEMRLTNLEITQRALCQVNAQRATENLELHREITRLKLSRDRMECPCYADHIADRDNILVYEQMRYLAGLNAGLRLALDLLHNASHGITIPQLCDVLKQMMRDDIDRQHETDAKAESR